MFASAEDIRRITQRVKPGAQLRMLRSMGIDCRPDGDGKPLVLKSVLERWLGAHGPALPKPMEPDFRALQHVTPA